jgi:hypothetical protein
MIMKKIKLFLLTISILCVFDFFAQSQECALIVSAEDSVLLKEFKSAMKTSIRNSRIATHTSNVIKDFPLQHHIVRTSNGSGGLSASAISQIEQELNAAYISAGIHFHSCGEIEYINSDTYYNFSSSQETALSATYNNPNAINIYYFNSVMSGSSSACGYTYLPTTNRNFIAIANSCAINGSTVIHEVGHFFGLLHTHDTRYGMEDPNESNCDSAGDLCCDTPADPGLSDTNVNVNCVYTGTSTYDGRPYNPDTHNYMSYSRKSCRDRFSNEQFDFIFAWSESSQREVFLGPVILANETITSNRTVVSCNDINVQNVTVTNGAKLTLDAADETIINGPFEVVLGSELEIK